MPYKETFKCNGDDMEFNTYLVVIKTNFGAIRGEVEKMDYYSKEDLLHPNTNSLHLDRIEEAFPGVSITSEVVSFLIEQDEVVYVKLLTTPTPFIIKAEDVFLQKLEP